MATLFRLPQIFKTWRRDPQGVATEAQSRVTENRNVALLNAKDTFFRGPGQAPNYDWPNPTLPKSRMVSAIFSQVQVWQNALVNVLAGKDAFFGGPGRGPNYDWPNPTLAKSRTVAAVFAHAQVWQNRLTNLLVGKDTFFGAPGMGPDYDWPNPIRRDPGRFLAAQGFIAPSLLVTLLALTQGPFTPVDQPNPRGAVNRVAVGFSVPNLLPTTLAGQDRVYGGVGQVSDYDWPNPRGPVNRIATHSFVQQNLFGSTLQALPIGQTPAWLNPPGPVNRVSLGYVPQYLFASTLQALPTGQRELGANPRGALNRLAVSFAAPNSLAGLLTPLGLPPGQSLWINPPMRRLQATAVFASSPLAILAPVTPTTTGAFDTPFVFNLGRLMNRHS